MNSSSFSNQIMFIPHKEIILYFVTFPPIRIFKKTLRIKTIEFDEVLCALLAFMFEYQLRTKTLSL